MSLAAATALWVSGSGAAQSAAAPRWQALPVNLRSYPPWVEPFWAFGRVWFLVHRETGKSSIVSARVRAGALSSFVSSSIPNTGNWSLVGSSVVYNPPDADGGPGDARSVALLAGGRIGAPQPLVDDPQKTVIDAFPKWRAAQVVAGVRIGARTLWLVAGGEPAGGLRVNATLAVCCAAGGGAKDLTSMITNRLYGTSAWNIGVDGRGRLWVAWADSKQNPVRNPRLSAHMVEFDAATLAVRGSKVLPTTTGDRLGLLLTCAASCRVVTWPLTGVFTWAAGDTSPSKIAGAGLAVSIPAGAVVIQGYDTHQGRARALTAFLPL